MFKACWRLLFLCAIHFPAVAEVAPVQIKTTPGGSLEILGLDSSPIVLEACLKTDTSRMQCSNTKYRALDRSVDTNRDKPLPGNFVGVDGAGIYWTAVGTQPTPIAGASARLLSELAAGDWLVTVKMRGSQREVILGTQVVKSAEAPFRIQVVKQGSVQGLLYIPQNIAQASATIFSIGGCPEGGSTTGLHAFLSSRGFTVFHAFYTKSNNSATNFKCAGDLTLLENELTWFRSNTNSKNIFLLGMSKGVEGALWLSNLSHINLSGLMLINGSNIQLPSVLTHPWFYRGKELTHLPTNTGSLWRRLKSGSEQATKRMLGQAPMRNQRKIMEEELDGYSIPELVKYSIPLNCNVPHIFAFSENDELIPVTATIAVIRQQCGKKVEIALNPNAGHSSMEVGNAELWRCMRGQEPDVGKEECLADLRAGNQNAERIVAFVRNRLNQ